MDTSPHIGGAADSQKDRGVRQRKSLVFLFVIPDSSDMQQNESVTARRNAHYRRKTCPPALRRNRSSMSVFLVHFSSTRCVRPAYYHCRFLPPAGHTPIGTGNFTGSSETYFVGGRDQSILCLDVQIFGQDPNKQPITGLSQRSQHSAV